MSTNSKKLLYSISGMLFLISLSGMLYYGYKTFYIEPEKVVSKDYTYHFALIGEEMDNDYWRLIEKGAKKAAAENDIYLEYVAPQKADNDEMLKMLDRLIAAKVDGIITQGVEGNRFVDLVHKGIERGIPITTVDTDVANSERKAYVGTDNFYAGQLLGKTITENTTGEQFVGIVTGRFDAINQLERVAGFKDVVEDNPRIHIVATGESTITKIGATQATYSLLKQYPQITVLVGTSALDGIGMVDGLHEIAPNKGVYIAAFDILPETMELIRQQKIAATITQYPEKMGYKAVEVTIDLQMNELLDNQFFTDTKILTQQDLPQKKNGEIR